MRFDEGYASWKDSSHTFYHSLKYIPISNNDKTYLSVGGEARVEYDYVQNEDWGKENIGKNPFWIQRFDIHGDLHFNSHIRLFAQIRSAWEEGSKTGPRPIDEDKLNVQNLFVDIVPIQKNSRSLTVRIGRQEVDYGSGRLISVREGPNLRLYFDGAKVMYASPGFKADAFVLAADTINTGAFDNKSTQKPNLWGTYGTWIIPRSGNFDFYYLGYQRNNALYEETVAHELRHTVGIRFWKYGGGFIYNLEAAYQFGKFSHSAIRAWTGSMDLGYYFDKIKGHPVIGVRNDYISGDKQQHDGMLETFNPLFPKAGYFGFNPQIGPANLIDLHPYMTWSAGSKVSLMADVVCNWRYSLQDGVYRPSGNFNFGASGSAKRYIGTIYMASVAWNINKFLAYSSGIQYVQTGSFLNDVIPQHKDVFFISGQLAFKF